MHANRLGWTVASVSAFTLSLALSDSAMAERRPHIVLMVADDLGWGDVGYHGSRIATPNVDRLTELGVQLNQFYVQPVCSPTRAALMTGRYPMRLGLQCGVVRPWAQHGLPLEERTLPQALRAAGYVAAICGKWHLGHVSPEYLPTRRGFDHQYGHYNGALDYFTHIRDGGHDWHRDDRPNYDEGYATDLIGQEACRILAEHDQTRPLFLYVPFNAPHTPLQAPQSYLDRYAHMPVQSRRVFAAMVTCMDDAVGRIVTALEKHHYPAEKTLIFFCSDNGGIPRLGSNGDLRAGKGTLYEGGVRVPAVMVWKDVLQPGAIIDEPLHIVDLYPTLLRLAGAESEQPKRIDGKDAWATITEGHPSPHESLLLNVTPFHGAVRVGQWKLIHNGHVGANATAADAEETWELFDLGTDPAEKHDLSGQRPELVKQLKEELTGFAGEAVRPNIPPNKPPTGFVSPKIWGHSE
jgi:arylsulfatase A-like enzyme